MEVERGTGSGGIFRTKKRSHFLLELFCPSVRPHDEVCTTVLYLYALSRLVQSISLLARLGKLFGRGRVGTG